MIVNKYSNGGGGSGSQGPIGPQGPQGIEGAQGPAGSGSTGDFNKLMAVPAFPESAETGDVVALASEGEGLPYGITFVEREYDGGLQGRRLTIPFGALDDMGEGENLFIGKVGPEGEVYDLNFQNYEGAYSLTYEDPSDPLLTVYPEVGSASTDFSNGVVFESDGTGDAYIIDIYPDVSITNEIVFTDIPEGGQMGVYQYDGEGWKRIDNIVHLDSLEDTEGVSGIIYECNGRYLKWVNGAGRWGKWIIAMDNNMYNNVGDTFDNYLISQTSYLVYTYLPFTSTTLLCGFRVGTNNKYLGYFPEDNKLKVFDDTGLTGTSIAEISMDGEEADITTGNRHMYISWADNRIIFRSSDALVKMAGGYVDTSVSAPHYEALDVDYFDGTANIDKTAGAGFAMWNSEGKVIGGAAPNQKIIYFNTTGYSSSISVFYRRELSTPNRIWVPTTGGNAGQMLISGGDNAAPVWSNWIKGVKITSAAYEALATKDPNTLYLIVDE